MIPGPRYLRLYGSIQGILILQGCTAEGRSGVRHLMGPSFALDIDF